MSVPTLAPEPPDELVKDTRSFWREQGRELIRGSINSIDETAKQIIGVAGIIEGLYFHAITFSDLRGTVLRSWILAIYLAPIVLLLFSLISALLVFFPNRYRLNLHSSEASQQVYEGVVSSKLRLMKVSAICLMLGVAALFGAAWIYLGR